MLDIPYSSFFFLFWRGFIIFYSFAPFDSHFPMAVLSTFVVVVVVVVVAGAFFARRDSDARLRIPQLHSTDTVCIQSDGTSSILNMMTVKLVFQFRKKGFSFIIHLFSS